MNHSAFAVKHGGDYLRFGSYRQADVVDSPLKATLYTRLSDAQRRIEKGAWIGPPSNPSEIGSDYLRVVRVTVSVKEEVEVPDASH